MNRAWTDFSKIIGASPQKVVRDVRTTGRKRRIGPSATAWSSGMPPRRRRLMVSTRIRLSFTTTPANATIPIMLTKLRPNPMTRWPMMAPTKPNGTAVNTTKPCK